MKKTIVVKGKSAPKKTVRKPFRKNDANKLSVCSIKGTCPIADVYNCQFTYGGYDPLTMSAIGLTRVSTSGAPTTSTTQSSQEVETSPTTTISSLLQRQASQVSTSPESQWLKD